MAAEAFWILNGDNTVAGIKKYSKNIADFSDDGEVFFGAYGPKVNEQIDYVAHALRKDQSTRQAVMTIWRENPPESKDIPCTVSAQWLIRKGKLHCIDTMRSSDSWLGWPYDVFNFTMLTYFLFLHLREWDIVCQPGYLYMNVGSQHLYMKDLDKALTCIQYPVDELLIIDPNKFTNPEDFMQWLHDMREDKMNQYEELP